MNLQQDKKYHSFNRIHNFLEQHGPQLIAATPAIANVIAQYNTLFDEMETAIGNSISGTQNYTIDKRMKRAECIKGIWKLTLAMKYHFNLTNDAVAASNIKVTEYALKVMPEKDFYSFSQMVLNQYNPLVYAAYGIVEAEINDLKLKLSSFPNDMQMGHDARLMRKLAGRQLDATQKAMALLLKNQMDPLVAIALPPNSVEGMVYTKHRYIGLISDTRGKPHKQGILAPGQIAVLDKHAYRRKRALIVTNTGALPLQAGIGLTETELHGTPFTIEPNQTRRRITQKLAPEGEYFLVQNMGEEDTGYEVWMKE